MLSLRASPGHLSPAGQDLDIAHQNGMLATVSGKLKTRIVVAGLLVIGAAIIALWFTQRYRQRQVEWWLDHSYPIYTNLLDEPHRYYSSYDEWSRAGQAITNADRILIEMYRETDSAWDKNLLLYAMGAVPTATTIEFLSDVLHSSHDKELRESAFFCGLLCNAGMEIAQRALLEHVKDGTRAAGLRCQGLAELLARGNEDAIAYARQHGEQLLLEARADGVHARVIEDVEKMLPSMTPESGPASR